jgi:DNA-binding NarL/FixJ family response regulator
LTKRVSLLIADDHPVFRAGIKAIIARSERFFTVAEAENGEAALLQIDLHKPDIVMLDIAMPGMDGLAVLDRLAERDDPPVSVIITSYDDRVYIDHAFERGARGYVLKDAAVSDVEDCLARVMDGGIYISPTVGLGQPSLPNLGPDADCLQSLTAAEKKVLSQVAEFRTSRQIAEALGVSVRTVQNHRSHICTKLDLHGAHQLLAYARDHYAAIMQAVE